MKFNHLSLVVGLATTVVAPAMLPEEASAAPFQVNSGVTSVGLNLNVLSSVGLNLTGSSGTVPPVSNGFLVGFPIVPPTNFTFDFGTSGFAPVGGTIEHTGSVTFNNSLTVGNFSIGFDPNRVAGSASGFFVRDTITTAAALFDVATPSVVSFANNQLNIVGELLVSPELAGVLNNQSLIGAHVGSASINATAAAVPEPTTMLGMLAGGGLLAVSRRFRKKQSAA